MLVLNRRPGESVIIEPDVHVTVLSVADRRVRISLRAPRVPPLDISAVVVSGEAARLEIGPLASVAFDGDAVRVEIADVGAAADVQAALAVNRSTGERVEVGDDAWVAVASVSKGNPCVAFGGDAIGEEVRITLIRPAGSYVRLGVEAPNRRVYREELWAAMQASGALDEPVGRFDGASRPPGAPNGHGTDAAATVRDGLDGGGDDGAAAADAAPGPLTTQGTAAQPAESPAG
jgi:sRNA-binding carbon storage regulator CsrA